MYLLQYLKLIKLSGEILVEARGEQPTQKITSFLAIIGIGSTTAPPPPALRASKVSTSLTERRKNKTEKRDGQYRWE
jgi:hypothetical protein